MQPRRLIYLPAQIGRKEVKVLIDTGANISCIDAKLLERLQLDVKQQPIRIKQLTSSTYSLGCVPITLTIGHITRRIKAHVLRDSNQDFILGLEEGALFKINLNLENREVKQDGKVIPADNQPTRQPQSAPKVKRQQRDPIFAFQQLPGKPVVEAKNEDNTLEQIIAEYNKHLSTRDPKHLYTVPGVQHSLMTTTDRPIASCPHRLTMDKRDKINETIEELLQEGKIRRSTSPYASPAFLVGKKDGKSRMVIDYRKLNEVTLVEPHPIPRMDDLLDGIHDPTVFSVIDLKGAYHHIRMCPTDIEKTAFVTADGHFEWLVMPFGLKNAPATFARYMNEFVRKHRLRNIIIYFDDILVATVDKRTHLDTLRHLFDALIKENLTVNTEKCHFLQDRVNYLGVTLNSEGIRTQEDKVEAIRKMHYPKNRHELMRFLGMVNFYHKFIPNYAIHAMPLHDLLGKDVPWIWNEGCEQATDKLKQALSDGHVLIPFSKHRETYLYTDASGIGIGAVLKQRVGETERTVAFYSKRLSPAQTRYTTSEQEALAIVKAIDHWNYYLDGHKFCIKTDHKPLTWLKTITDKNRRLFNWSIKLSTYDYAVEYIPGEDNIEADALSRAPVVNLVTLQEVRNALERSEDPTPSNAYQEDGIIYIDVDSKRKLYVPESLRMTVVNQAHREFGHLGVKATSNIIQLKYYWPHIASDIQHFIDSCDTCARCKNYQRPKKGELRQIPPVKLPMELVSMDTVSGFRDYGSAKSNMTVIVDHATRYAWTFASKKITDDQAINCLNQVMTSQGPLKTLLTDRYPAYFSRRLERFLSRHSIEHKFTTPYHPAANGVSERVNRTLVNKLRCLQRESPRKSWPRLLQEATLQYNNTIHSATSFPPSYLLLGRATKDYINENHSFPELHVAREMAFTRIQEQHARNKAHYDQGVKPIDITVGDLVYTRTPPQMNVRKLTPPFEGPWRVVGQRSPVVFEIEKYDHQNHQPTTHFHCTMLKKCKEAQTPIG